MGPFNDGNREIRKNKRNQGESDAEQRHAEAAGQVTEADRWLLRETLRGKGGGVTSGAEPNGAGRHLGTGAAQFSNVNSLLLQFLI